MKQPKVLSSTLIFVLANVLLLAGCTSTGSTKEPQTRPINTAAKIQAVIDVLDAQMAAPAEMQPLLDVLNRYAPTAAKS